MSTRNYLRLNIEEFGKRLLVTGDLDPIYVALTKMVDDNQMDLAQLARWLVAYWCFYHAGVASYMSEHEGADFWRSMLTAAENVEPPPLGGAFLRWPRGGERRHFRGQNAIKSIDDLTSKYGEFPEDMVRYIAKPFDGVETSLPFKVVSKRAQEHVAFGPWIGFKVADMIDRVMGFQVDFDDAAVFMFDDPTRAALMLYDERADTTFVGYRNLQSKDSVRLVAAYLTDHFKGHLAPPLNDRPVNIQEVETILCKWKSHVNGHYPVGKDIHEIREGLAPWGRRCITASRFLAAMPEEVKES